MKSVAFLLAAIAAIAADQGSFSINMKQPDANMYHQQNVHSGQFNYGYNVNTVNNQFQHKVKGPDDVTYGCYGYIDPSNRKHLVYYVADRMGYRIIFPNRPTKIFTDRVTDSLNKLDGATKAKNYDEKVVAWNDLYMPESCFRLDEILSTAASSTHQQVVRPEPELPRPTQYTIPTTTRPVAVDSVHTGGVYVEQTYQGASQGYQGHHQQPQHVNDGVPQLDQVNGLGNAVSTGIASPTSSTQETARIFTPSWSSNPAFVNDAVSSDGNCAARPTSSTQETVIILTLSWSSNPAVMNDAVSSDGDCAYHDFSNSVLTTRPTSRMLTPSWPSNPSLMDELVSSDGNCVTRPTSSTSLPNSVSREESIVYSIVWPSPQSPNPVDIIKRDHAEPPRDPTLYDDFGPTNYKQLYNMATGHVGYEDNDNGNQLRDGDQTQTQQQPIAWSGSLPDINPANINLDQFDVGNGYVDATGSASTTQYTATSAQYPPHQLNVTQLLAQIEAVNSQVITLNTLLAGMANNPGVFASANEGSCRKVIQLLQTQRTTPQLVYVPILIPYVEGQFNVNQPFGANAGHYQQLQQQHQQPCGQSCKE